MDVPRGSAPVKEKPAVPSRLAILADIHGDVHALRDALVQIERLKCDCIVNAGDLVDWGIFPEEAIDLVREHKIPSILGNHDRWAIGRGSAASPEIDMDAEPWDCSGHDLRDDTIRYLADLSPSWRVEVAGVRIAVHLGTPHSDMDCIFPDETNASQASRWLAFAQSQVLVVGHTHIPFCLELPDGKCIVNPGALLRDFAKPEEREWLRQLQSRNPRRAPASSGTFGVLHLPSKKFSVFNASDGSEAKIVRKAL